MPLIPPSKIAVSSLATRKPTTPATTTTTAPSISTASSTSSAAKPAASKLALPATPAVSTLRKPTSIAATSTHVASSITPSRLASPAKRAAAITSAATPSSSVRTAPAAARPLSAKAATKPAASASPTSSVTRTRRPLTPSATPPVTAASPVLSRETSHASSPADSPRSVSSIASSSSIPQPTALRLPSSIRSTLTTAPSATSAHVVSAAVVVESVGSTAVVSSAEPLVTVALAVHPDEHAQLLASHRQLQTTVVSLTTQLHEWQQKAEQWQSGETARQTVLEEKEKRQDELLTALQSTLADLLTQHQQSTQQQAEQAAAAQQRWQQTVEQQKVDSTAALTAQRDELLTALTTHQQNITSALTTQHDTHTTALATLDSTVSQHSSSITQLLPLDEEVGSIRTVLDAYNEDISGLVEREEAVRVKVEALRVESEQLLSMTSEVSGRCKRVQSEVIEVKRATVEQAAEWKATWVKVEARVDEVSERLKEWTVGWVAERKVQQAATQQLVSGQHEQEQELAAVKLEVQQMRQSLQQRHHTATLVASKQAEEQKDGDGMTTERKEAADDRTDGADVSSTAVNDGEAGELASSSHFTAAGPLTVLSNSHDADHSSTASPFLHLSPAHRTTSTSLSLSSDSLLPTTTTTTPQRSHSISLPASPSDLSSVFPSVSVERQLGVFTSPAKVVQSTQAMAWTINVKDGKGVSTANVATPPPRHSIGGSRDGSAVTPRSAVNTSAAHRHSGSALSTSAGKSGGSGRGSVVGSGRSSVSGSGVSSPSAKVSRQLASELDENGAGGSGGAADIAVAADEQHSDGAAVEDDEETY